MYTPKFELLSFASLPEQRKQIVLRAFLEALVVTDWNYILEHPETPALYDAGLQYVLKVRPAGLDAWQDIPQCLALSSGDCKDFACLRGDTLVRALSGDMPIRDVVIGEQVLTRQGFKRVAGSSLTRRNAETCKLVTDSGREIVATPDHRVWTDTREWVECGSLRTTDRVLEIDRTGRERCALGVKSVMSAERADVYDIAVEDAHEFFANGVLVHNCWRVAELRHQGYDDVYPHIKVSKHPDPNGIEPDMTVYHIQVRIHDIIEDPSAILGMPTNITYDQLRGGEPSEVARHQMAAGMFQTSGGIYMPHNYFHQPSPYAGFPYQR